MPSPLCAQECVNLPLPPERALPTPLSDDGGGAAGGSGAERRGAELSLGRALDTYSIGATEHRLSRTLPRYFIWSAGELLLGLAVAFLGAVLLFLLLVHRELYALLERIQHLAVLPTFVVVIGLQQLALFLNGSLGTHIRIAAGRHPAVLIPVIALSLIPGAFIRRSLAASVEDTGLATSLWAAKARGVSCFSLLRRHLLSAGLEAVSRNRSGLFTYLFANILVAEHLCNLPGITRALFGYGFVIRTVRSTDVNTPWGPTAGGTTFSPLCSTACPTPCSFLSGRPSFVLLSPWGWYSSPPALTG
jgi:hypothetical protein